MNLRVCGIIMLMIRKDMGNSKTKISLEEIITPIFAETSTICNVSQHYGEVLDKIAGKSKIAKQIRRRVNFIMIKLRSFINLRTWTN